jgi:hypothetical protein
LKARLRVNYGTAKCYFLEVALDIEQLLYETTTLLNAAGLIDRMARQS